jgi:hypothetical protein
MSLNYEFKNAARTIARLSPEGHHALALICKDIQQAEHDLNQKASALLSRCITSCTGICCRNIRLDEIIGFYDFIYLLTIAGGMKDDMAACLKYESLFSSNCLFLKNGNGPCMFPENARPRICITSFCFDDAPVKHQIRDVNRRFSELSRFVFAGRLKTLVPSWFHK